MTVDITTKLAAIRSIVDDIAVHLATQGATSSIAPRSLAAIDERLTRHKAETLAFDRLDAQAATLDAMQRRIDDLSRRVHDLAVTVEVIQQNAASHDSRLDILAARTDENDAHIEHIEGRQDAMEAAWQLHVDPGTAERLDALNARLNAHDARIAALSGPNNPARSPSGRIPEPPVDSDSPF